MAISWSKARTVVAVVLSLAVAVLGGVAWHSRAPAPHLLGAPGNYAFPVGPAQINGVPAGTYPNLVFDAGPLAQPNAVVVVGPDAGDGGAVTYAMLAGDRNVQFDTSATLVATATLGSASSKGECHTFRWWNWADAGVLVQPVVTSDAGMVPATGQALPGSAGLVTSTSLPTPGVPFTLCADGVEWVTQ